MPLLNNRDYLSNATIESIYPGFWPYDAMNLITYLHQMARNEFLRFLETGYLRVNSEGIVVRNLNKYRIKNGRVELAEVDQRGFTMN